MPPVGEQLPLLGPCPDRIVEYSYKICPFTLVICSSADPRREPMSQARPLLLVGTRPGSGSPNQPLLADRLIL